MANPKGNIQNLKPLNARTKEEQAKIVKQGGIKSGEARRAKKTFKELAQVLLNMEADSKSKRLVQKLFPDMDDKNITSRMAMISRQYEKAVTRGDSKAFEVLRDTAGEKPVEKLESTNKNFESNIDLTSFSTEKLEALSKMTDDELVALLKNVKLEK
jgi:hypothetical protein